MSRRFILLGASNLNMGLPRLMRILPAAFDGPLEVFAALGHGRSFGIWSRVLHRELPSIIGCGLWPVLEASGDKPDPTCALITDVGNDLLYGFDAPQIAAWVETCLSRLQACGAHVVLTSLPIDCVDRLKAWRYYATRAMFFPGSRVTFEEVCSRAHALHERLLALGPQYGATVIELPGKWYGVDPIHFRLSRRSEIWRTILCGWPGFAAETPTHVASPKAWVRAARLQPQLRRVFGQEQHVTQPVLQEDRLTVSLY